MEYSIRQRIGTNPDSDKASKFDDDDDDDDFPPSDRIMAATAAEYASSAFDGSVSDASRFANMRALLSAR
jgi:hypothetical protein